MDEKQYFEYLSTFADADAILNTKIRPTIRINTLKISKKKFFEITELNLKPTFYEYGFYVDGNIEAGATWEYFLGYMHTQSLSSMLPSLVLNPSEMDLVLDATASPGSKTTHMAMIMNNKGAIMANDINRERISILFSNITRLGVLNTKITIKDAKRLGMKDKFTKVLLDAPCTALSSPTAYKRLNNRILNTLSRVQKKMILSSYDSLKPGGTLVYSTCTYTKEENEEVVDFLLSQREDAKIVDCGLDVGESGLSEFGSEFKKVRRIYPYHFNSEGFFIAKIQKG